MAKKSLWNKTVAKVAIVVAILAFGFRMIFTSASAVEEKMIESPVGSNGCPATLDFTTKKLASSKELNLCEEYKGKVVLIVNTASKCGYTDQFDGLENLYKTYKDKGFVILGFPSNDFANQDPESEEKIAEFCRMTYGVNFPMFQKTHAAEKSASPIYKVLGGLAGEFPRWNFHKYLLDREGNLIASLPSPIKPDNQNLIDIIEKHL